MKKPFFIGIAGGSASGKTTFCNNLEKELSQLNVKVYHMDEYFKPVKDRPYVKAPISGNMYTDDNHPDTVDLNRLKADINTSLEIGYDVIIIEGLLTLWDNDIYEKLDLKLFIDCKEDERIVRRLRRNMKRGLSFDEIANVYLDMVRFRHNEYVEPTKWKADFILNGSVPSNKALNAIAGFIRSSVI